MSQAGDLEQREREYKQLNEKLEAETAKLVEEADLAMRQQEDFLAGGGLDEDKLSGGELSEGFLAGGELGGKLTGAEPSEGRLLSVAAGAFGSDDEAFDEVGTSASRPLTSGAQRPLTSASPRPLTSASQRPLSSKGSRPPTSKGSRPLSAKGSRPQTSKSSRPQTFKGSRPLLKDVAVFDDFSPTLGDLERDDIMAGDDIMPGVAAEMGQEAQVRFLKAKLRVFREELERARSESRGAVEERNLLRRRMKEREEEAEKMRRSIHVQQSGTHKLRAQLEEEKKTSEAERLRHATVWKEMEALKRDRKQSAATHGSTELRLNRALEELEKTKSQLGRLRKEAKESAERDHAEVGHLRAENKRLERLRGDAMAVMKKQQKLAGVLKKQILHLEAAKLLSFTEDEFLKALDWGK